MSVSLGAGWNHSKILGGMILVLKDSHTDIWSPYGRIQYDYTADHPNNYSETVLEMGYLKKFALRYIHDSGK